MEKVNESRHRAPATGLPAEHLGSAARRALTRIGPSDPFDRGFRSTGTDEELSGRTAVRNAWTDVSVHFDLSLSAFRNSKCPSHERTGYRDALRSMNPDDRTITRPSGHAFPIHVQRVPLRKTRGAQLPPVFCRRRAGLSTRQGHIPSRSASEADRPWSTMVRAIVPQPCEGEAGWSTQSRPPSERTVGRPEAGRRAASCAR